MAEPNVEGTTKTFTQEELDSIVQGRVSDERKKYSDYEALKEKAAKYDELEEKTKTDLQKAQDKAEKYEKELNALKRANSIKEAREKVASEAGIPADLLTGETEDECKAQAEALKKWAHPNDDYTDVRDGGEPQRRNGKKSTAEQFADWFNGNA